jgi:hypothetical protein
VLGKKARRPITTEEPPVPTDSHAEIEDWMIRLVMPDMEPLRQADDPGGGAGTGDAQVDRTSGARAGLEMRSTGRSHAPGSGREVFNSVQPRRVRQT